MPAPWARPVPRWPRDERSTAMKFWWPGPVCADDGRKVAVVAKGLRFNLHPGHRVNREKDMPCLVAGLN